MTLKHLGHLFVALSLKYYRRETSMSSAWQFRLSILLEKTFSSFFYDWTWNFFIFSRILRLFRCFQFRDLFRVDNFVYYEDIRSLMRVISEINKKGDFEMWMRAVKTGKSHARKDRESRALILTRHNKHSKVNLRSCIYKGPVDKAIEIGRS